MPENSPSSESQRSRRAHSGELKSRHFPSSVPPTAGRPADGKPDVPQCSPPSGCPFPEGGTLSVKLTSDAAVDQQAIVSKTLATIFRGRFCDLLLANRKSTAFRKHEVVYDVGDRDRAFYFLKSGFVRIGTVAATGQEIIYDIRKSGDVFGELCASERVRPDRAVALEEVVVFVVPFEEVMTFLSLKPEFVSVLMSEFGKSLKQAYEQVGSVATEDTTQRVTRVLARLAARIGERSGDFATIPIYLTQEEIAHMAASRRERTSTALNLLRRRGIVQYSTGGHILLKLRAVRSQRN